MIDRPAVLAVYDAERADPVADAGYRVQRVGPLVRMIGRGHHFILYAQLDAVDGPRVVAEQAAEFRGLNEEVEWKVCAHDRPAELPGWLAAAGFVANPPETLMVYDLAGPLPPAPAVPGLEIRQVHDGAGVEDAEKVAVAAFGRSDGSVHDHADGRLDDPTLGLFVAYLRGEPISSGRVEMPAGRSFASLWGGGTVPAHRGAGAYRALVAVRAELARSRGFRYLTVDARDSTSRPILERLGFEPLTGLTGWVLHPVEDPSTLRP